MSEEAGIQVWFSGADENFSQLIGHNLGPGFSVKLCNPDGAPGCEKESGCVLLDLRAVGSGTSALSGLAPLDQLRQGDSPLPVIVLTGR